ncbi:MAG: hypothetical protein Q8882_00395 [Bacillota bacterium]|nr:hypothetical protein [Bacillota bacterium]
MKSTMWMKKAAAVKSAVVGEPDSISPWVQPNDFTVPKARFHSADRDVPVFAQSDL